MRIHLTKQIACTPEQLWPYLEEPELQKKWMKGLVSMESTSDGPTRPGSTFRMRIREGGKETDYDGEITTCDNPRKMGVRFWGGGLKPGMVIIANYDLVPNAGGTRLDYLCGMETNQPLGLFMKLMMPLGMLFGKWQAKSFLNTLAQLAEKPA